MSRPIRILAAVCLLLTALLSALSVLTQPAFAGDPADRLAGIDAAGATGVVSIMAFALAQLPLLVGVVAVAALTHAQVPRTAWTGGVLAVLGGFGHAVFGGIGLAQVALAQDAAHRVAMGAVVTRIESGPAGLFMAMGLLGTVLGVLTLGIALFRSRVVSRWVPVALWAFLAIEFALSNLTAWASPFASILFVAAFGALAVRLVRGPATVAPVPGSDGVLATA